MMAIITPRAIPVNFFGSGKASNLTYEFYNPSALARQVAFGQLLIALCYADVIKPRETITSNLEWIGIAQFSPNADTDVDLSAWTPSSLHHPGIQTVVGRVERASAMQIGPHISWHDRPQIQGPR